MIHRQVTPELRLIKHFTVAQTMICGGVIREKAISR
jgi:hypothetical protein